MNLPYFGRGLIRHSRIVTEASRSRGAIIIELETERILQTCSRNMCYAPRMHAVRKKAEVFQLMPLRRGRKRSALQSNQEFGSFCHATNFNFSMHAGKPSSPIVTRFLSPCSNRVLGSLFGGLLIVAGGRLTWLIARFVSAVRA